MPYDSENICKVTVYDGKHHSVDSKEIAFVQAGKKAGPIIMEPGGVTGGEGSFAMDFSHYAEVSAAAIA